jgi:hypothetical protein
MLWRNLSIPRHLRQYAWDGQWRNVAGFFVWPLAAPLRAVTSSFERFYQRFSAH